MIEPIFDLILKILYWFIDIVSSSVVFTTKDIQNIISWFERIYSSDEELSDYERETYLKLAKYFILDEKAMSWSDNFPLLMEMISDFLNNLENDDYAVSDVSVSIY